MRIAVLQPGPELNEGVVLPGTILDRSRSGMRIATAAPLRSGTPVRIDFGERSVFAEVCYCQPANGSFALGLELKQAVASIDDLSKLTRALASLVPASRPAA